MVYWRIADIHISLTQIGHYFCSCGERWVAFLEGIAGYVERKGGKNPRHKAESGQRYSTNGLMNGWGLFRRALPYAECYKAVGLGSPLLPFPFLLFCSILFAVFFLSLCHIYWRGKVVGLGRVAPAQLTFNSQFSIFNFQFSIETPLLVFRPSSYSFLIIFL